MFIKSWNISFTLYPQGSSDHQENDGYHVVLRTQVPFYHKFFNSICLYSRGAIAYALSLHLEFDEEVSIVSKASSSINVKVRKVLVTTTLIVVLFTTIVLGGGTLPLVKYLVS